MKGQSLIELLIAIGLAMLLLPTLFAGFLASRGGKAQELQQVQAFTLLKEANEAIRNIRENGWTTFAVDGTYHPQISGSSWVLANGPENINGITRKIVISDVNRDVNGNIVTTGGTADPSTKLVTTTISWTQPRTSSISSAIYLSRYLDNAANIQTTQSDFNAGTNNGTAVTNTSGGEVILSAGGHGNWCYPVISGNARNITGQGSQKSMLAYQGNVFFGTGGNASGDSMDHMSISDPPWPTIPAISSVDVYNNFKSYGLFVDTNYAYLTSDHPGLTIDIVQITNKPYSQSGTANAGSAGQSVFVANNIGYVTTQNSKLYTFDFSIKTGSHSPIANVALAGIGNKVVVVGSKAYVAINSTSNQIQIIQSSNKGTSLSVVKSISLPAQSAQDIYVNSSQTRAYVVTEASASQREFFIVDVDPTSATYGQVKGNYEAGGMSPKGVIIVPGNYAIIGGVGGVTYQVINISNETNPVACGSGLTLPNGSSIFALSAVLESDGDAFSYLLTNDSSTSSSTSGEFKMIEGGPGALYASSGTFTSAPVDPGFQVNYNRFTATVGQPTQTTIKMQVAVANPTGGNNCSNTAYNYIGPDNTSSTFYTPTNSVIQSSIPSITNGLGYQNPGRCFSYKVYLTTTDLAFSPTLYDVSVNYSP